MIAEDYRTIRVEDLEPGEVLAASLFDSEWTKLLDSGRTVDEHLLGQLRQRGVKEVFVKRAAMKPAAPPALAPPLSGIHVTPSRMPARPVIDACSGCGSPIALHPPTPESPVSTWLCRTCGAVYFGSAAQAGVRPAEAQQLVDAVTVQLEAHMESVPPAQVRRLVKALHPNAYTGPERREDVRYPVSVPVVAVPLSHDFRIDGDAIRMTTANVSLGGAALVHTRFSNAPFYALDFTAAGIDLLQVVLRVLRVRNLGLAYEIGGQFTSRVAQVV